MTSAQCVDCGADTTPENGDHEYYMVGDGLWQAAGMDAGYLCIGCLEKRLGRELLAADFIDAPVNTPEPPKSPRLISRLLAMPHEQLVQAHQKADDAMGETWEALMDAVEATIGARGKKKVGEAIERLEEAYDVHGYAVERWGALDNALSGTSMPRDLVNRLPELRTGA
jgi:hypothetical protein